MVFSRVGEIVGKVTQVTDALVNVVGIGLDIAELALAQTSEQKITFGVQLGFDTLTFGVGMGAMAAGQVRPPSSEAATEFGFTLSNFAFFQLVCFFAG